MSDDETTLRTKQLRLQICRALYQTGQFNHGNCRMSFAELAGMFHTNEPEIENMASLLEQQDIVTRSQTSGTYRSITLTSIGVDAMDMNPSDYWALIGNVQELRQHTPKIHDVIKTGKSSGTNKGGRIILGLCFTWKIILEVCGVIGGIAGGIYIYFEWDHITEFLSSLKLF